MVENRKCFACEFFHSKPLLICCDPFINAHIQVIKNFSNERGQWVNGGAQLSWNGLQMATIEVPMPHAKGVSILLTAQP